MAFEYDYGDDWRINLILEKCEKLEISATELPRVITGEGFGIIEDCGGVAELVITSYSIHYTKLYDLSD